MMNASMANWVRFLARESDDRDEIAADCGIARADVDAILGGAPPRPDPEPSIDPLPPPAAEPKEALPGAICPPVAPDDGGAASTTLSPDVAGRPAPDYAPPMVPKVIGRWSNRIPIGKSLRMFDGPLPAARTCQFFTSKNHLGPTATKCGKPTVPGSSYCCSHHQRVWVRLENKGPRSVKHAKALIDNGGFA